MSDTELFKQPQDKAEYVRQNVYLTEQCLRMRSRLEGERNQIVPALVIPNGTDVIETNTLLRRHLTDLVTKIDASVWAAPYAAATPPAAKPIPTAASLTAAELRVMTWTEKVQFAGNRLSLADAKKIAAVRLADLETLSRMDQSKLTVDERCKIIKAGGTVPPLKKI